MRKPSPLLALGGLVLAGLIACGGWALSQVSVGWSSLFGNETVEVQLGVGGASAFVTSGRLTSGKSYAYFTAFPASFTMGSTAVGVNNVNTSGMINGGDLMINAAAAGTTVYTFPPNPVVDGTVIGICNATATVWAGTSNTVAANTNQSILGSAAFTTLGGSTCAHYIWNLGTATWINSLNP